MQTNNSAQANAISYRETKIGNTLYRITSVYLGPKDLRATLEQLVARKVYDELTARADNSC